MSAPTANESEQQASRLSPAPAVSLGALFKAGSRSVNHSSLGVFEAWASRPSAPNVIKIFLARDFCLSRGLGDVYKRQQLTLT